MFRLPLKCSYFEKCFKIDQGCNMGYKIVHKIHLRRKKIESEYENHTLSKYSSIGFNEYKGSRKHWFILLWENFGNVLFC